MTRNYMVEYKYPSMDDVTKSRLSIGYPSILVAIENMPTTSDAFQFINEINWKCTREDGFKFDSSEFVYFPTIYYPDATVIPYTSRGREWENMIISKFGVNNYGIVLETRHGRFVEYTQNCILI